MGTIFAFLLLFAGIFAYFITGDAPVDTWSHEWILPSDEDSASLDKKIDDLRERIEQADSGEMFSLNISQEEATSKLHCLCRDGNISLNMKNPQIYFHDGMIQAFVKMDVLIDIEVAFEVQMLVEGGKLNSIPQKLYLGKIPIPRSVVDTVVTALEREFEKQGEEMTIDLYDIDIDTGFMIVTLVKR